MTGDELIKRLRRLAKAGNKTFKVDRKRGKGSHARVDFGDRSTTIPHPRRELKAGTFAAILRQLSITKGDLEGS